MSFKLTDSQYRAVYDSKKNILVSAGAGSGKQLFWLVGLLD